MSERRKTRISLWLSASGRDKLDDLSERFGTQAGAFEIALDRLWLEEIAGTLRRPKVAEAQGDEGDE